MEIGIQTVMTFVNECTSLQMAVYCETFKGTKKVQCSKMARHLLLPPCQVKTQASLTTCNCKELHRNLKNNNKLHENSADRKYNRIFDIFSFVKANPDGFQSPL